MSDIYIHYGHIKFDKNEFDEIKNRNCFVKPFGGLWASLDSSEYGWKKWTEKEDFYLNKYRGDNYFRFKLKENSRILKITNSEQLKDLPHVHSNKIKAEIGFIPIYQILDFEELSKEYDAMEVMISKDGDLYFELYGWDCDSLLVFNKDCIEVIDESN